MFTALEGPGSGHQEQHQPDPVGGLCIEPELIKRPPPVPRFLLLFSFHRGCPPPAMADGLGLRPCSPGHWGRHMVLCPLLSGSQTVAWYCSSSGTEVGQRTGVLQAKGPQG